MDKVDYSIEFAHIYADQEFSNEHASGVRRALNFLDKISPTKSSYALCVLVDNYNPITHTLDQPEFIHKLESLNAQVDYIAHEATLAEYSEYMLRIITRTKLRREYTKYIEQRTKAPCSFLVAIWYLMRLGKIEPQVQAPVYRKNSPRVVPFTARNLVNILPSYFGNVEKQALDLIAATSHGPAANNITAIFFESNRRDIHANLV